MSEVGIGRLYLAAARARGWPSQEDPSSGEVFAELLEAAGNEHHRARVLDTAFRALRGREPRGGECAPLSETARRCVALGELVLVASDVADLMARVKAESGLPGDGQRRGCDP